MTIASGSNLGRYEIRSQIGAGGMGEVYLAQDTKLDRKVAIKFLPESLLTDERASKRLVSQARQFRARRRPKPCLVSPEQSLAPSRICRQSKCAATRLMRAATSLVSASCSTRCLADDNLLLPRARPQPQQRFLRMSRLL